MYSNAAAVLRADIQGVVEQGMLQDSSFIAEQVMPVWDSTTKSGQYPLLKPAITGSMDKSSVERGRGGSYPRNLPSYSYDTFTCHDYGEEEPIDDYHDRADLSRFFDVEVSAARRAMQRVKLGLEYRAASAIMSSSNFTATAAKVNWTETNIATINAIYDFQGAQKRLLDKGHKATTAVMDAVLFNQMVRSTLFRNLMPGGVYKDNAGPLATPAMAAQVLGLREILVGEAVYNTAAKNKTVSASSVWGTTYIWVGVVRGGDLVNSGAGRIIRWSEVAGSTFTTSTYRDEEHVSDIVRVNQFLTEKVVDTTAGELITTSYSAS